MPIVNIIALIAALLGAAMGLLGLIKPEWSRKTVRLAPDDERPGGYSEFRASFGGLFLFFNGAVLMTLIGGNGIIGASFAAAMAWLGMGLGRVVSLIFDGGHGVRTGYNIFAVAFEWALGFMLLAPFIGHIGGSGS